MEYFYVPQNHIYGDELTVEGDEFAHLTHVMRKHIGDEVRAVDGRGNVYDIRIKEIVQREARCTVTGKYRLLNEPDLKITLGVALLKNFSRFDFLVEKTSELGVTSIVPLLTERTIPQHAKQERWQKLALAAMKQSQRCILPTVHQLAPYSEFILSVQPPSIFLIPHEDVDGQTISKTLRDRNPESVVLCIGPEGGFTQEEVRMATRVGGLPVTLGPRRLRTETAAIVAVASALA